MTKHLSLSCNQDFSTQANETVVENNNLLATGEVKPWPLCIKPLKAWSHFSWISFISPWGYCSSWQAGAPPAKFYQSPWSWHQADLRGWSLEVGHQEANWDIFSWRRTSRRDLQEPGCPAPWCCSATQHHAWWPPRRWWQVPPWLFAALGQRRVATPVEIRHPFDQD